MHALIIMWKSPLFMPYFEIYNFYINIVDKLSTMGDVLSFINISY